MATYSAQDLLIKPVHGGGYGDATLPCGKVVPSSAVVTGDILRICRIPAGMEVNALLLAWTTFGTTAPGDIGYTPVNPNEGSLTTNNTYFKAGHAFGTASADGTLFAGFDPIKFEQDVFLTVTFGTVSSGAAGTIRGNVLGTFKGVR